MAQRCTTDPEGRCFGKFGSARLAKWAGSPKLEGSIAHSWWTPYAGTYREAGPVRPRR